MQGSARGALPHREWPGPASWLDSAPKATSGRPCGPLARAANHSVRRAKSSTRARDEKDLQTSCVPNIASMQLTNVLLAVSRALSWMCQGTAISSLFLRGPRCRSAGSFDKRRGIKNMRERSVDAADEGGTGPRKRLLSRFLPSQGNSVDDRRKRLFTEREIQMLFRHRQRELRSPLQPLREI